MARNLDSSIVTAVASEIVRPVYFVELHYDSGISRANSTTRNIIFGGNIYLGIGTLGSIESIQESIELQANGVSLTLNGVEPAVIATALNENYQGRTGKIYLGHLNENFELIANPAVVFVGRMDTQHIRVGKNGVVTISLENRLIDWERPRVLRYNNETQQKLYPGDKGLEFVEQTARKTIFWGVQETRRSG